ncbi:Abi family protein, partial [Vitellibacter sp. q18]|nr:Abi family protein [Aequorivita lutea]
MKPFKTLDEQLAILEARGLVFSDKENAKKKLSF